jgi:hypothetical protein
MLTIDGLEGKGRIVVQSVLGKTEQEFLFIEKPFFTLNLQGLANGLYFISIQTNQGTIISRVALVN